MYVLTGERIKKARMAQLLIIINIACFIAFNIFLDPKYWSLMVQYNEAVFQGQIWRLFTAMFIHANVFHIFSNMLGLFLFGATLEGIFSRKWFLLTYFVSGLLGNIFSLFLYPPLTIGLGASGAIYGLMGATFIILAKRNPMVFLFGAIYIGFSLYSSLMPGIGFYAHFFGLLGGLLFGLLYNRREKRIRVAYNSYDRYGRYR